MENLLTLVTRPTAARMITFLVLALLLVFRPNGIFERRKS